MFQCSRVPFVKTKLHKCKSALGYYCGDIQTGKLQEFNEALKEKKKKRAVSWTEGGKGIGSELHLNMEPSSNNRLDVVNMQNHTMARR